MEGLFLYVVGEVDLKGKNVGDFLAMVKTYALSYCVIINVKRVLLD